MYKLKQRGDAIDDMAEQLISSQRQLSEPHSVEAKFFHQPKKFEQYLERKTNVTVAPINLPELQQKLEPKEPHYGMQTYSNLIRELRIHETEYKKYSKYLTDKLRRGYDNKNVDLTEFVMEKRFKDQHDGQGYRLKGSKFDPDSIEEVSLNQVDRLKKELAYALQTQVN